MSPAKPCLYTLLAGLALTMAASLSSAQAQTAPAAPVVTEAAPTPAAAAPTAPSAPSVKAPEAPKPAGPTYNPPPPSGKDWGKLPQESREQILNEWKALSEKDREPFIFYRERAMAKLPDSAYTDNPYKPDVPEAAGTAAKTTGTASTARAATPATATDEKPSGGIMDKLFGKDDAAAE